ncbi:MAG: hypothetical protein M3Q19_00705 [Pseudomonadota bacterium]|nr:hypothetical protein [Pseudomonadota bacterium]
MAAFLLSFTPATAQENKLIGNYPAEKFAISPGGVDLRTGRYVYSATDLSIGPDGEGALKLTRIMSDYAGNHANPFGNFSHNWDIFLLERILGPEETSGADNMRMTLHFGGRALTFQGTPAGTLFGYKSDGPVAWLTLSGGGSKTSPDAVYTAELADGTVMLFRPIGGGDCASGRRCAFVSEMTEPDGTKYAFTYSYDGAQPANRARLTQVISNRGYALLLEGSGSIVTKACVLNLAISTIPANGLCPAGVPTSTYAYTQSNTKLASATDASSAVSQFSYVVNGNSITMGFIKPGETTPWLTNYLQLLIDEELTVQEITGSQAFVDGRSYGYGYDLQPQTASNMYPAIVGGRVIDQSGKSIIYQFDFPIQPGSRTLYCDNPPCSVDQPDGFYYWTYQQTPGPVLIEDELGRQTKIDYCDPMVRAGLPSYEEDRCAVISNFTATDPEGASIRYEHDGRGNVRSVTKYPKPGSTLDPIVSEAAYATTNIKTQAKPLWVKDGKDNQTDYTYDPNHGDVLTETGPAVNVSGTMVRPQKRYAYVQRHAWLSNGSGGYAAAPSPVWLLASESFCRTSAATGNPSAPCATAGDEVLTTYDYGPNSGPNNLWLRGKVVTADNQSRRTCFGYDSLGRRISETTPNANLTSCR